MITYYLGTILSYLLYQAAIGGLFFVFAKSHAGNPLVYSVLLMVEPILLLLFGIQFAKVIDKIRGKSSLFAYIPLSLMTLLCFLLLFGIDQRQSSFVLVLLAYSLVTLFFIVERIYRQRISRDFSIRTGVDHARVNAITNLANRGAPILSPLAIYISPLGLNTTYLFGFLLAYVLSTSTFIGLNKTLSSLKPKSGDHSSKSRALYNENRLGAWHIWHLSLMNLVLGGLFMVLSQTILISTKITSFLQGPSLYFSGFWVAMFALMLLPRKEVLTPFIGLFFTATLGILLLISSTGGYISIFCLCFSGICYGFAVNYLGAFIQGQLSYAKYSYYETRAQTFARMALIIGLLLTGYALNAGLQIDFIRGIMGVGVLFSSGILWVSFIQNLHLRRQTA